MSQCYNTRLNDSFDREAGLAFIEVELNGKVGHGMITTLQVNWNVVQG